MAPQVLCGLCVGKMFTLGLFLLFAIQFQSVIGFSAVKDKGPDPQIKIFVHPPLYGIVSRKEPLLLPCVGNFTASPYDYNSYEDEIDSEELQETEKIARMHNTHFSDLIPDEPVIHKYINADSSDDVGDDIEDGISMFKRNTDHIWEPKIIYKWLRNGENIENFNRSDFQLLQNGTLKIFYSKLASAVYQCIADGINMGIGAVISRTCTVQQAVFNKISAPSTIFAKLNSSVVLNCPFYSIPSANITWQYSNNTLIDVETHNRYFQLRNGSLLVTQVNNEDNQKFKCIAKNMYSSKAQRQFTPNIQIVDGNGSLSSKLLPNLQSTVINVMNGSVLNLFCAAHNSELIVWNFTHRLSNRTITFPSFSVMLRLVNVSQVNNDGFYACTTSSDMQVFNVTITSPPIVIQNFSSIITPMGAYIPLNCTVTGNPMPTVTWYKNGQPIEFGHIITYDAPILKIYTYEEMHKGIYQCVARNEAGETQVTALLSWQNKSYMKRPEKVKCYPINRSTVLVEFQSKNEWNDILYYTSSRNGIGTQIWNPNHLKFSNKVLSNFLIKNMRVRQFEMFYLYFRGLEKTGSEKKGDSATPTYTYEMSRLSKGVKCSTQGLEIFSVLYSGGIFIWWPSLKDIKPSYCLIQIWHNGTSTPTKFSDQIVGTIHELNDYSQWPDIQSKLVKISATTNIYPQYDGTRNKRSFPRNADGSGTQLFETDAVKEISVKNGVHNNIAITEVRVPGNVTGILLPNTNKIIVRVLVPIIDGNGELIQDTSFVEWKSIPDSSIFQIYSIDARNIILNTSDYEIECIRACYTSYIHDTKCQNIFRENSLFSIRSLLPNTTYKIQTYSCNTSFGKHYDEITIRTIFDVPGPIRNHKLIRKNGIKLEWSPPLNSSGNLILYYYLIEWTTNNGTHSVNVSKEVTSFQFPPTNKEERFNVTIRAIGNVGVGLPIYINLKNFDAVYDKDEADNTPLPHQDPTLGIAIGILLSIFCIIICVLIIIKHRTCNKNGPITPRHTSPTAQPPTTICNQDLHEMQTLIAKPTSISPIMNGEIKHNENGNGTKAENENRKSLITSTLKHFETDSENVYLNELPAIFKKTFSDDSFTKDRNAASNGGENVQIPKISNINEQKTHTDGDTDIPQTTHSNQEILPSSAQKANGNLLRITENPQYITEPETNSSIFDNSQQQLLNSTISNSNIDLETLNETDNTIDLNGGNSYTHKPLYNWSFRRPIVGPNG